MDEDVYFHKTVNLRIAKEQLKFRTSQELFSSHDIDIGTRALLRSIIEVGYKPERILDMGCGGRAPGVNIKKAFPEQHRTDGRPGRPSHYLLTTERRT